MSISKITVLLIFFPFILYFILTPLFHINDESEHYKYIIALSELSYPRLNSPGEMSTVIPDIERLDARFHLYSSIGDDRYLPDYESIILPNHQDRIKVHNPILSNQAYHPPLYYIPATILYWISQIVTSSATVQVYIVRITSGLFFAGTVFFFYKSLVLLYPKKKFVVSALLVASSINPIMLKMAVGINPDIGLTFWTAVCIWLVLYYRKVEKWTNQTVAMFAIVIAMAILTKFSGIVLAGAFLVYVFIQKQRTSEKLKKVLIFSIVGIAMLTPWFFLNTMRYGSIVPQNFSLMCNQTLPALNIFQVVWASGYDIKQAVQEFSGFLGWGHVAIPFSWFYRIYLIGIAVLFPIGLYSLYKKKARSHVFISLCTILLGVFLFILAGKHKVDQLDCTIHGRYLLPVFFGIVVISFEGLKAILHMNEEKATYWILLFTLFQFYFILMYVLLARYFI